MMSHHGDDPQAFSAGKPKPKPKPKPNLDIDKHNLTLEQLRRMVGATGQFPRGHLNADDEGELRIAIAADHANSIVRLEFGKPTAWIGFDAEQAMALADSIRDKANELRIAAGSQRK